MMRDRNGKLLETGDKVKVMSSYGDINKGTVGIVDLFDGHKILERTIGRNHTFISLKLTPQVAQRAGHHGPYRNTDGMGANYAFCPSYNTVVVQEYFEPEGEGTYNDESLFE